MPVKSVIQVDVDDEGFKPFLALFDKYQAMLARTPAHWAAGTREQQQQMKGFQAVAAALMGQAELLRRSEGEQRKNTREVERQSRAWDRLRANASDAHASVRGITASIAKWTGITSLVTGLLGIGGLFGLTAMAHGVAEGRRRSMGLGVGMGQSRAFRLNFGRFVDPGAMLGSVAGSLYDVTSRGYTGLLAAGLSRDQLARGNAADVSVELLRRLPQIFAGTPQHLIGARLRSLGLDEFMGQEDVVRYLRSPPEERERQLKAYERDRSFFSGNGDNGGTGLAWQDFATQMSRAGDRIESTFVRTLVGLAKPLERLSEGVERTVNVFMGSERLRRWIGDLGDGIERLARYVVSDDFQVAVQNFAQGAGDLAESIVRLGKKVAWLVDLLPGGGGSEKKMPGSGFGGVRADSVLGRLLNQPLGDVPAGGQPGFRPLNNPGNLRPAGASTGFMQYATEEEGIRAMARQLQIYQRRDRIDTISGIVSKYAPASENDVKSYVGDVSKRSGFGPDQKLNLADVDTLARVMSAMIRHEGYRRDVQPKAIVEVLNNTGGNAVVSTSQVAVPQ